MIVVDASVLTNAFTDDGPLGAAARTELAREAHWAGPEHLLVGAFSAIRGRWLGGKIREERALDALAAITGAIIETVAVQHVIDRMWELRKNVRGYDAAYLAMAEALDAPLVTADTRLTRVPDTRCEIRLALPPDTLA